MVYTQYGVIVDRIRSVDMDRGTADIEVTDLRGKIKRDRTRPLISLKADEGIAEIIRKAGKGSARDFS
jgi:hypothetical protein